MVRLKFTEESRGKYRTDWMVLFDQLVFATVTKSTYEIYNSNSNKLIASGTGSSLRNTKAKLRKQLIEMGVIFHDEIRNK